MTQLKIAVNASAKYAAVFVKWLLAAVLVGAVGGIIGSIFHLSVDFVTELRTKNGWIIFLLPLGGVLIAWLYSLCKNDGKIDTNRVISAVRSEETVPFVMGPLIFVSTVITHLVGGSAGREGAALQLGGSIGSALGKVLRLKERDRYIIVMFGMSAVFAALFGTPVTAAFFSLEVASVGAMYYAGLVPCVISALVASRIALLFGLSPVCFDTVSFPPISADLMLRVVALAILCALVSILFCTALKKCEEVGKSLVPNKYLRGFSGGVLLVLLTLLVGTADYNGAGMDIISRAMLGDAKYEAFLLKIVFTAITVAAGFKGGEIVPTFFIGSTFGCMAGAFLGLDPSLGAAIGFVALFCGVVNCPVASLVLATEVFGGSAILMFAVVCAVSYMLSGSFSLYESQSFMYSKINDKVENTNTM